MKKKLNPVISGNFWLSLKSVFKKYLKFSNYRRKINRLSRSWKTLLLKKKKPEPAHFSPVWSLIIDDPVNKKASNYFNINVFGEIIDYSNVDWNKDYFGNFVFPSIRMDKIKISNYYDKGIDVKFPWELSRFTFSHDLSVRYMQTRDESYYRIFRDLVLHWINNNPFLIGVNWLCTMDVAIRATNWIISATVFHKQIKDDDEFSKSFEMSLVQHASFIYSFPEIYEGGHTTNHTTADYTGLLFLSLALPDHPKAMQWQKVSILRLVQCIKYQTYKDGGSFEASIGYHRLVTELFSLVALLCIVHNIKLPRAYFRRLNKMYDFIFSLMDTQGNLPNYGDNDSSTLIDLKSKTGNNHAYLFGLKSIVFGTNDQLKSNIMAGSALSILPQINPENMDGISDKFKSIKIRNRFSNSGIHILRNESIFCAILNLPLGLKGQGAHNHYDIGSFTVSFDGLPMIVDPGTFTYSRDFKLRNQYRAYHYHNTLIPDEISESDFNFDRLFQIKPYYTLMNKFHNDKDLYTEFSYKLLGIDSIIKRSFQVDDNVLIIKDSTKGKHTSHLYLSPKINIKDINKTHVTGSHFDLQVSNADEIICGEYDLSDKYNLCVKSNMLKIKARGSNTIKIMFHNRTNNT